MTSFSKLIKKADIFSLPVNTFYTSRDKKINKKTYHIFHGSTVGGLLTILFVIVLAYVLQLKILKMFSGELDITRHELYTNPMKTRDQSVALIYESNFMASLKIQSTNDDVLRQFDVFNDKNKNAMDDMDFDQSKLARFFTMELWMQEKIEGKSQFYISSFKRCTLNDF